MLKSSIAGVVSPRSGCLSTRTTLRTRGGPQSTQIKIGYLTRTCTGGSGITGSTIRSGTRNSMSRITPRASAIDDSCPTVALVRPFSMLETYGAETLSREASSCWVTPTSRLARRSARPTATDVTSLVVVRGIVLPQETVVTSCASFWLSPNSGWGGSGMTGSSISPSV